MNRMPSILAVVLVAGFALAGADRLSAQQIGLPIGSRPQPVQLENVNGETVDLGQYIGRKPMFVEFWATWCELCEALQPRVNAAHAQFGDRVEFVTVAVGVNQTMRSVRQHVQEHPVPGHVVFDADGRATRAFAAPATSYVVVLDASGRVVYTGSGDDQDLDAAIRKALSGATE